MGDRNDENLLVAAIVDDYVRKPARPAATKGTGKLMPSIGEIDDALDCLLDRIAELVTKSRALGVVGKYCFREFALRGTQETDGQTFFPSSAKTCLASTASISPAR